jgi:hypothetical protein
MGHGAWGIFLCSIVNAVHRRLNMKIGVESWS